MSEYTKSKESVLQLLSQGRLNFTQIANVTGYSRERVRQIALENGLSNIAWNIRHEQISREAFAVSFRMAMKRWLWRAGYRRCYICELWKDNTLLSGTADRTRRCKECDAAEVSARLHATNRLTGYYAVKNRKYPLPPGAKNVR